MLNVNMLRTSVKKGFRKGLSSLKSSKLKTNFIYLLTYLISLNQFSGKTFQSSTFVLQFLVQQLNN